MPPPSTGPRRPGPSSTVTSPPSTAQLTFLFTDIEASTRAWERHPDAMPAALARHDALLHQAVDSAGGRVFKHTGDGMLAVFGTAPSALAAALAAQAALQRTDWKETGPLRVRMALHSGVAECRGDDYFGPALNRAARLLDTAHGGQLVTSLLTAELLLDELPPAVGLVDQGEHRLADLARPERIFQITHPDLPSRFPPLRSLGTHRHNLPVAMSSFIGRERELEAVGDLLRSSRLVTLSGPGGVGKTRLALQVVAAALDRYPDGAFMVELATVTDPSSVVLHVIRTLRLVENPTDDHDAALERLCAHLGPRRLLLLLDNCEHVIDAVAALCDAVLRRCAGVVVLATSREPLAVGGEVVWRVPPLGLPASEAGALDTQSSDAVTLFCERARAAGAAFCLTRDNVEAVTRICRRLDGIPLAIELAAARVRVLSPEQIADRLDDRFRLLSTGPRSASARHQTLRATMDWSYELLSEPERLLLQRIAVFAGGFDLAGTEDVAADGGVIVGPKVLDLLTQLVDRSLVVVDGRGAEARYRLLETVREYALEKLAASGMEEEVRRRHRDHFVRLTEPWWEDLGAESRWIQGCSRDEDNLRAALEWSMLRVEAEASLRLAVPLGYYWTMAGHLTEGRARLEQVLSLASSPDTPGYASALSVLGFLLAIQGDVEGSLARHAEAVELAEEHGDLRSAGFARWWLASRVLHTGDHDRAEHLLVQAHRDLRATDSLAGMGWCEFSLGWIDLARGDRAGANRRFQRALDLGRAGEGDNLVAHVLATLAPMAALRGERERARALAAEAVEIARRFGLFTPLANTLLRTAEVGVLCDSWDLASSALRESLALLRDTGGQAFLADSLEMVALVRQAQGAAGQAARLLGAARGVREALGESSDVRPISDQLERSRAAVERSIGAAEFAAEWERGRRLSAVDAVCLGLEELTAHGPSSPPRAVPAPVAGRLRLEGRRWVVGYQERSFELPDTRGLRHLSRLLAQPGCEVHVLDLAGAGEAGDAGPVLDVQAKAAYRARVQELRREIDEAEAWNDPERATRAQLELDALIRELAGAVGLGGRDRLAASAAERARVSVRKALAAAIARIAEHDADLGLLLSTTVSTGTYCTYTPDPRIPVTWHL